MQTWCNAKVHLVNYVLSSGVELDLMYSDTCQANFAVIQYSFYQTIPGGYMHVSVQRQSDGKISADDAYHSALNVNYLPYSLTLESGMVYAPVAKARAYGSIDGVVGTFCTSYYVKR